MIVAREDVHEILKTVEWPTLFFFVGLFIVVGGVVKTGIISDLAHAVLAFTGGRTDVAALVVLWMSGLISAIVDNIPYTITMVPLVQELGQTVNIHLVSALWRAGHARDDGRRDDRHLAAIPRVLVSRRLHSVTHHRGVAQLGSAQRSGR